LLRFGAVAYTPIAVFTDSALATVKDTARRACTRPRAIVTARMIQRHYWFSNVLSILEIAPLKRPDSQPTR
jgi:hypothetical protein